MVPLTRLYNWYIIIASNKISSIEKGVILNIPKSNERI